MHGGHTDRIADFSWNENAHWFLASVADDNVLQVWQPSEVALGLEDDGAGGAGDAAEPDAGKAKRARVDDADLE